MNEKMITYKDSGVDVERGYEAVRLMKSHVQRTFDERVLGGLGSFGGFYSLEGMGLQKPVLVAGNDGVGTKLKIAFAMDKHDTVGQDCVAMCVDDIVCQGAKPLIFLDYLATGKLDPAKAAEIVRGIADACVGAGCALIGGETAEMPGFYPDGEYDLAGFSVGIVDRDRAINGSLVKAGDVLVGLPSTGVHSNGFSLVRRLVGDTPEALNRHCPDLGCKWGEELLTPTRIYTKIILDLVEKYDVHGIAHITGGGFIENIPRTIPEGLGVRVQLGSWPVTPVFHLLAALGKLDTQALYNTFNMGIGMVLVMAEAEAVQAVRYLSREKGESAFIIGEVVQGGGVQLCG